MTPKIMALALLGLLSLAGPLIEMGVTGRVESFGKFALAESFISLPLIYWWYHVDKDQRNYKAGPLMNVGVVALTILALPVYFIRSRGWKRASIAQPFWSLLSPHGLYSKAAIVHDYLYWSQLCTREQADNIFLIAMKESGVAPAQRLDIYAGVRAGGGAAWNANRDERARGLPRVIPENFLRMPSAATWAEYRKTLVARGVNDPSF